MILPATTFLEGYDFARAYGPISLQLGRPVIDAVGESRPNADVFSDLAKRMGVLSDGEPSGELELLVQVFDALPPRIAGDLGSGGRPEPPCGLRPIQFVDVFPEHHRSASSPLPGRTRRQHASRPLPLSSPIRATARYPLALISPASDQTISSTLGELPRPDVKLTMHPDDAAARGLEDKDPVRIFNDLGEVHCPLAVSPSVPPGTVSLPKGLWRRSTQNGSTGTALVPDALSDIGGGACFNDARVQVASIATA